MTPVAGTTRDLITERIDLNGMPVTLVDTAGDRKSLDVVEREGVSRAAGARQVADVVLVVLDQSVPLTEDDRRLLDETTNGRRVIVANKADIRAATVVDSQELVKSQKKLDAIYVSALSGYGINELRECIVHALIGDRALEPAALTNLRHIDLISKACEHVERARAAASLQTSEEFLLADLQAARVRFDEVVGTRSTDDVLAAIFQRFCIGK